MKGGHLTEQTGKITYCQIYKDAVARNKMANGPRIV
jgi:hypothetical protein